MSRSYSPKLKINLIRTFNRAYAGGSQELRDALRGTLTLPAFREQYGKAVIDRIVQRTHSGIDKNGNKFAPYSKTYMRSDVFRIYRKTSQVNLELTGEMLSSMQAISEAQTLTIEFLGELNKAKAYGHVHGIRTSRGGRVVRDFLGLPDAELDQLLKQNVEQFRNDGFSFASDIFRGKDVAQEFGIMEGQPEIASRISVQSVLAQIARGMGL